METKPQRQVRFDAFYRGFVASAYEHMIEPDRCRRDEDYAAGVDEGKRVRAEVMERARKKYDL